MRSGVKEIIGPDDRILRESIKRGESFRAKIYDDGTGLELKPGMTLKGRATIGWGRNLHEGISQIEGELLVKNDISRSFLEAEQYPWFHALNSARQRVVVEMLFNLGKPRFDTFKNMIEALDAGLYDAAANEMIDSKWADQVGNRAVDLAAHMRMGE